MSVMNKFILGFLLAVSPTAALLAKDWHGITPLTSTRKDVERLLGPPTTDRGDIIFYDFEKETVSFRFSKGSCGVGSGGWNVPQDVVISVWVTPNPNVLKFTDLKLDATKYKKERDDHVQFIVEYVNEAEGVSYQVDTGADGMVTLIKHFPMSWESHLRCPETHEALAGVLKVDEYTDIPFASEKVRLDGLADKLGRHSHKDPRYADTVVYIMAYAGRRARAGEALARANRAKDYLVKVRGIERERIVTIDGGNREELMVELYLLPPGASPPIAAPTVEPSEVRLEGNGRRRYKRRVMP
jgi:hypothetical protein